MKKLIGLDLDGTLTQHRTAMDKEHRAILDALGKKFKLIMVAAGSAPRVYAQMQQYPIDIIANYGMQESRMVDGVFTIIRDDKVLPDRDFFCAQADYLRKKYGYSEYVGESVEFHASGMITFPLLGTKAAIEDKLAFDPDRRKRHVLYPEVVRIFSDYEVFVGGSSSFDFAPKGYNKFESMLRYGREHGYNLDEMLYVGDDFGPGGGDSHIRIGGMDYIQIEDYRTSPDILSRLLN